MTTINKAYLQDANGNAIRPATDWSVVENAPDFASQIQNVKNSLTGDSGTWTSSGVAYLGGTTAASDGLQYKFVHIGAYKALMISGAVNLPAMKANTTINVLSVPVPDWWDGTTNGKHTEIVTNYLVPLGTNNIGWLHFNDGTLTLNNSWSGGADYAGGWFELLLLIAC